ncbi:hypothetical protein BD289DRAFT_441405 [Coniella lustricola]|uniref:Reverse transcriptase domain-containing protein n=1 Tax=Coniella lustricola TaxID=2025994 RepID=A0A2T2ZZE6_9PEZI|nr:hypothetical protein BD289DRAFT_441405 [Coniella lustricola]
MLEGYEAQLWATLEEQTRELRLARLYTQLVTEWMDVSSSSPSSGNGDNVSDGSDYKMLDRQKERLQALCDKFEAVVFEPLETDQVAMDAYLRDLFTGKDTRDNNNSKLLAKIRDHIGSSERAQILDNRSPFDVDTLIWAIKGLLIEDLLSEEKQDLLRDMLRNEVVLREIADVLNMRLADLENWSWDADSGEEADDDTKEMKGISVLPRQQLNGKYRIWMDEDVIQAILIHYIGMKCCVFTRAALTEFVSTSPSTEWDEPVDSLRGMWKWNNVIPRAERMKRNYYLGRANMGQESGLQDLRRQQYIDTFFLSQLPKTEEFYNNEYTNNGEPQDFDGSDCKDDQGDSKDSKHQGNIKQKLLRLLASDALIHRHLHGEVAVVQSDLQWYATGLSHTAIFTVMRFLGFSPTLLEFLRKVLQAPLSMQQLDIPGADLDGKQPKYKAPRIRQRGVPMAHAIEKLIGELMLFIMDLAVNQSTGMLLYRLHDDLWLCGDPEKCTEAWATMQHFARIFGLEFNMSKTGSVYLSDADSRNRDNFEKIAKALPPGPVRVGHLLLEPSTGQWIIDSVQVAEHVTQLGKQLTACERHGSVLEWVRTWNSCIGRFFSHTFGEPAPCFGAEHAESILKAYKQMQASLFGATDVGVVQYVKKMLRERFTPNDTDGNKNGGIDIPDAFITLPEELGGLGVCNPFIPILIVKQAVAKHGTPQEILARADRQNKHTYESQRKRFDGRTESSHRRVLERLSRTWQGAERWPGDGVSSDGATLPPQLRTFFSVDEYMRWQEITSADLEAAYRILVDAPDANAEEVMALDEDVQSMYSDLLIDAGSHGGKETSRRAELQWNLQLYREELRREVGGMRLVEEKYLPLGVLAMMRQKTVRWNMVL